MASGESIYLVHISESNLFTLREALSTEFTLIVGSSVKSLLPQMKSEQSTFLLIFDLTANAEKCFTEMRQLRRQRHIKSFRSLVISSNDQVMEETKALEIGANDYLRMPLQGELIRRRVAMHFDLLKKAQLEHIASQQELMLRSIFSQAPIGVAIVANKKAYAKSLPVFLGMNAQFEQILGRSKEEQGRIHWMDITHPDDLDQDAKHLEKLLKGEISSYRMEKRYLRPDGSYVWTEMIIATLDLGDKSTYYYMTIILDISQRKEMDRLLKESERSKSVLLSNLPGMAYRCDNDPNWTMRFISAGCYELTGYLPEYLIDNRDLSFNDIIVEEYREQLWVGWTQSIAKSDFFSFEYEIMTATSERKWVYETGRAIYSEEGEVEAIEGIVVDINSRKAIEEQLLYLSQHDPWTGLFNRANLEAFLNQTAVQELPHTRALISINLMAFHTLSVRFGFNYSQELLKRVSRQLERFVDENHQLFHTYEYRFVFYVQETNNRDELEAFCQTIAREVESLISAERLSFGIGVLSFEKGQSFDVDLAMKDLLVASEQAYAAADVSSYEIQYFDEELAQRIRRSEYIVSELNRVVADESKNVLFLQFQPIIDLKDNQICAFEALARLQSQDLGLIAPLEFIQIAEKTRQIIPLGKKILHLAFSFVKALHEKGYYDIPVSINISPIQLLHHDFSTDLNTLMMQMKIDPHLVILEITESVYFANYSEVNHLLGELRHNGIKIAIDDFGTGYSSLARIGQMNIDYVKIDRYFISGLLDVAPEKSITQDIISLIHRRGYEVVAEGVEYPEQKEYLLKYGCDKLQGYMVSHPLDEIAAIKFLKTWEGGVFGES